MLRAPGVVHWKLYDKFVAQPADTYFYTATVSGGRGQEERFIKGTVTLVR